jgi:hypothetical protein
MARRSFPLLLATALAAASFAASADSYVMVHPGTECTETPHIAGGMYGSTAADQSHIGYWNDDDSSTVATVFCPIDTLTKVHLEEYDWDPFLRVSPAPVRSMTSGFPEGTVALLNVYVTRNNSLSLRDYCWVDVTYPVESGGAFFDSESSTVLHLEMGFNLLQFNLTGLWSPGAYATLVCRLSGVDGDTGLPSQIAGYTLEVVE